MRKLSKHEMETVIKFNEGSRKAVVYTFNGDLKRRLAEFAGKYPLFCRLESLTKEGSVTYAIDKSRLSIQMIPPYGEEQRAVAMAYAKENGFQSLQSGKETA